MDSQLPWLLGLAPRSSLCAQPTRIHHLCRPTPSHLSAHCSLSPVLNYHSAHGALSLILSPRHRLLAARLAVLAPRRLAVSSPRRLPASLPRFARGSVARSGKTAIRTLLGPAYQKLKKVPTLKDEDEAKALMTRMLPQ